MNPVPETMRAAVLYGREDVRLESVPVPKLEPGDLLLRVEAALTCGTDLKVFRRGYHAQMIRPPSVFGHEMAGTVAAVAPGPVPPPFAVGERVVVANSAPCGVCPFCRRGQENLCDDLRFINGAYAEYLRVPARFVARNTLRIPDGLSCAEAALTEPLACVVQGMDQTQPQAGDRVLLFGLGPIGLLWVALLKHRGCRVTGVDRLPARAERARAFGADETLVADADGAWRATLRARGAPFDVVVEATGAPEAWAESVQWVRKGGRAQLFSGCPAGTTVTFDTNLLHYGQLTLLSSFHHRPATVRAALEAIACGAAPAKKFISAELPLAELPGLLRRMLTDYTAIKTCIRPDR